TQSAELPAPKLDYSRYRSIAILPFDTEGFLLRYGSEIADQVIIELLKRDPGIPIVERARVDDILRERTIHEEVSPGRLATAELVPADLILTGSVAFGIENIDLPGPTRQARLSATVRVFETDSGQIIWAARFSVTADDLLEWEYRRGSDLELRESVIERIAEAIAKSLVVGVPD
ncbi:hypothetical protein ACFL6M_07090, partial [Candidatus Eisenbacteria bacterium]